MRTGTRHDGAILQQCGKKVKSKSQKILGTNFAFGEVAEKNG